MKIVGITSCTCGIAHTYMAREKLLETGKKLGWSVKIETQGSGGIEFALTDQDIQEADCVLLATDVAVSGTERFKGKPVVKVPVSTAIKSPEHLLKKIEEKLSEKKKKKTIFIEDKRNFGEHLLIVLHIKSFFG